MGKVCAVLFFMTAIIKSAAPLRKKSTRVSNQNRTILQSIYSSAHINSRKSWDRQKYDIEIHRQSDKEK
jgi:hypothetical protein